MTQETIKGNFCRAADAFDVFIFWENRFLLIIDEKLTNNASFPVVGQGIPESDGTVDCDRSKDDNGIVTGD